MKITIELSVPEWKDWKDVEVLVFKLYEKTNEIAWQEASGRVENIRIDRTDA